MKDKIQNALLLFAATGILTWAGSQILDISTTKQTAEENRESIQALIDLHLHK